MYTRTHTILYYYRSISALLRTSRQEDPLPLFSICRSHVCPDRSNSIMRWKGRRTIPTPFFLFLSRFVFFCGYTLVRRSWRIESLALRSRRYVPLAFQVNQNKNGFACSVEFFVRFSGEVAPVVTVLPGAKTKQPSVNFFLRIVSCSSCWLDAY